MNLHWIGKKVEQVIDEKKLIEDIDKKLEKDSFYLRAVFKELIYKQPQADKWIPCSSKILPDEMKEVLISRENSKTGTSVGYYNKVFGWYDQCLLRGVSDVVAWMPKPIEYKKEGNQ